MILATLDAGDVTLIGGIVALFYAIIQIGNYLWGKKTESAASVVPHQSHECSLQHSAMTDKMNRTQDHLVTLVAAQANLSNALAVLIRTTDTLATAAEFRHQQVLQAIKERDRERV